MNSKRITFISDLRENADRIIAKLKRKVIKYLLVGKGKAQEILFGDFSSIESNELQSQISDSEFFSSKNAEPFMSEAHVWQSRYILKINNVRVDTKSGICFGRNDEIIAESSSWPINSLLLNSIPIPIMSKVQRVDAQVFDNILLPSNGFYHWLIEDLPNTIQLIDHLKNPRVIVNKDYPRYVLDFIRGLKVPVIYCERFIQLDSVLIITKTGDTGWPHPNDLAILQKYFASKLEPTQNLKLYIPRTGFSRVEEFERHLIQILENDGWQIYLPHAESLEKQIAMFSKASVIAGLHGAGLCGMLWMDPGSHVIEILPKRRIQVYFRMSKLIGIGYSQIHIESLDPLSNLNSESLALEINNEIQNRIS